jgi:hypothetical protein
LAALWRADWNSELGGSSSKRAILLLWWARVDGLDDDGRERQLGYLVVDSGISFVAVTLTLLHGSAASSTVLIGLLVQVEELGARLVTLSGATASTGVWAAGNAEDSASLFVEDLEGHISALVRHIAFAAATEGSVSGLASAGILALLRGEGLEEVDVETEQ